jgi:GH24 family phage-related lysozyme (muramidase)
MFLGTNVIYSDLTNDKNNLTKLYPEKNKSERNFVSKYQFEEGYEEAIRFIKEHEGYAGGKIYVDVAGIRTIGYGHVILATDTFTTKISKELADKLVRQDFDKAINAIERETDLTGYKKIAMAHFVFAKGIGNFTRSNLKRLMEEGKPLDEELKKWCFYRSPEGKMIRSEYSYNIRLWEIEMYNK